MGVGCSEIILSPSSPSPSSPPVFRYFSDDFLLQVIFWFQLSSIMYFLPFILSRALDVDMELDLDDFR